jgi:hypothetical protein
MQIALRGYCSNISELDHLGAIAKTGLEPDTSAWGECSPTPNRVRVRPIGLTRFYHDNVEIRIRLTESLSSTLAITARASRDIPVDSLG